MTTGVAILGIFIAFIGLAGMVSPAMMKELVAMFRTPRMLRIGLAVRFLIGAFLIWAGPYCRIEYQSQLVVRLIGVLTVAAAILFMLLGPRRVSPIIQWWLSAPPWAVRLWALIAILLGGYLIYASGVW